MGLLESFTRMLQSGLPGKIQGQVNGRETTFINYGGPLDIEDEKLAAEILWRREPHLRTVIGFLARKVAQLGIHVYQDSGETRERVHSHPLVSLIKKPNDYMVRYDLIAALVTDIALYDEAYLHASANPDRPEGFDIHVIPANWVTPEYTTVFEAPFYHACSPDGEYETDFSSDEIIAWKGWTPGAPERGTSPVHSLREILAEQASSRRHRLQVWKRNGRVGSFVTRPIADGTNVPKWDDKGRKRFMDMLEAFTGNNGSRSGGMPLLEDGMEIKRVGFSSADEQWAESVKLSLNTCAQVYYINPTMVGDLSNANYANVREFRNSLYGDSLGPLIVQLTERLNAFLLPMIEAPDNLMIEFNVEGMLRGSFEEQGAILYQAAGGPYMTVNEVRRLQNLPPVEGGDELIRPLSVSTAAGDAEPTEEEPVEPEPEETPEPEPEAPKSTSGIRVKARPSDDQVKGYEDLLRKFFKRQRSAVVAKASKACESKADLPSWWDSERWNRELSEDLQSLSMDVSASAAREALAEQGLDPALYDQVLTEGFLKSTSRSRAEAINGATIAAILKQVAEDVPVTEAINGEFDRAEDSRSIAAGAALATAIAGWGSLKAGKQAGGATKTWITGPNPRPEHASMDGETVGIDDQFSNGLSWPGDSVGSVGELAGCNCDLQINFGD